MEKKTQNSVFDWQNIKINIFNQIIDLNMQYQKSQGFLLLIQIFRLIIGNSQIFSIFIVNKSHESVIVKSQNMFSIMEKLLRQNIYENYSVLYGLLGISILLEFFCLSIFFFDRTMIKKYLISDKVYFIISFMKNLGQFWFSVFAVLCLYSLNGTISGFAFPITLFSMVIYLFMYKIIPIFQQKNVFQSKQIFSHRQNVHIHLIDIIFCMLSFSGTFIWLTKGQQNIISMIIIMWTLLSLIKINITVVQPYYQVQITQQIETIVSSVQIVQLFIQIIDEFIQNEDVTPNLSFLAIILICFLNFSFKSYQHHRKDKSLFCNDDQIKQFSSFYSRMNILYTVYHDLQQNNLGKDVTLIVSSIRRNHKKKCKILHCYCRKSRDIMRFFHKYLLQQAQVFKKVFATNIQIQLYILSFEFHVNRLFTQVLSELKYYQNSHRISILNLFKVKMLNYRIKQWVIEVNQNNQTIKTQMVLQLQQELSNLNCIVVEDVTNKHLKWKALNKKICRQDQIRQFSQKQIDTLRKMQQIKQTKLKIYDKCLSFNAILYFYYKKIMLKTENLTNLQNNIKVLFKSVGEERIFKLNQLAKHLYHQNTCAVQTCVQTHNFGTIFNVSKTVNKVFGYSQVEIIGKNMAILLPKFLVKIHNQMLDRWVNNQGNFKNFSKIKEIYCLHKQQYCFSAVKYMKLFLRAQSLTIITVFLKKNQNDFILIDQNKILRSFGKKFTEKYGKKPYNVQANLVLKNIGRYLQHATQNFEQRGKSILFDQRIVHELQKKKRQPLRLTQLQQQQANQKILNMLPKLQAEQTLISDLPCNLYQNLENDISNSWRINFTFKKVLIKQRFFYVIHAKSVQLIRTLQNKYKSIKLLKTLDNPNEVNTFNMEIYSESLPLEDQQKANLNMQLFESPQMSSIASSRTQLGFNVFKIVEYFQRLLFNPSLLRDKKSNFKFVFNYIFVVLLIAISLSSLYINSQSVKDKQKSLRIKSQIDRTFHLIEITTNILINTYKNRNDQEKEKLTIKQVIWTSQMFEDEINNNFKDLMTQKSSSQKLPIYNYLKQQVLWFEGIDQGISIQLLQFFKKIYYIGLSIREQIDLQVNNQSYSYEYEFLILTLNLPTLHQLRETSINISEIQIAADEKLSRQIFIIFIIAFGLCSLSYISMLALYSKYRFQQTQNHCNIYQRLSNQMIESLNEYYQEYYVAFVLKRQRIDDFIRDSQKYKQNQFTCEVNRNKLTLVNKVRFVGKRKFKYWILFLIIGLSLNAANAFVSYSFYKFNNQISFFSRLTSFISDGQSVLVNRLTRLKGTYYFDRSALDQSFLDNLLFTAGQQGQQEPNFNKYVTFDPNEIFDQNQKSRNKFNEILQENVCDLNKQFLNDQQFLLCNQQAQLSKNGIITFMNGFSRAVRNSIDQFKQNLNQILQSQDDYFLNQVKFRQVQTMLFFHVFTFQKLTDNIVQGYKIGFESMLFNCTVLVSGIIVALAVLWLTNVWSHFQDKNQLIYLYGYALLFPPIALKQNKSLLNFIKTNLDFKQQF